MAKEIFWTNYVHEQKPFNNYVGRLDFVVYAKNKKFGVDIFYPISMHSFVGCINSKLKIYKDLDYEVILVQASRFCYFKNKSQQVKYFILRSIIFL